jgi:hypothetical protein
MKSNTDIVSIASWRQRTSEVFPEVSVAPRSRSWISVTVMGAAVFLLGLIAVFSRSQTLSEIRALPAVERAGVYQRSIDDLERSCTTWASKSGALRDHCVQQATFVLLLPECHAQCQDLARSILPRARR